MTTDDVHICVRTHLAVTRVSVYLDMTAMTVGKPAQVMFAFVLILYPYQSML